MRPRNDCGYGSRSSVRPGKRGRDALGLGPKALRPKISFEAPPATAASLRSIEVGPEALPGVFSLEAPPQTLFLDPLPLLCSLEAPPALFTTGSMGAWLALFPQTLAPDVLALFHLSPAPNVRALYPLIAAPLALTGAKDKDNGSLEGPPTLIATDSKGNMHAQPALTATRSLVAGLMSFMTLLTTRTPAVPALPTLIATPLALIAIKDKGEGKGNLEAPPTLAATKTKDSMSDDPALATVPAVVAIVTARIDLALITCPGVERASTKSTSSTAVRGSSALVIAGGEHHG